jgi:hypothetical protein
MNPSLPTSEEHGAMLPDSAWLQHRDVLHKLYIGKKQSLKEVKHTMEEVYGFPVMR